MMKPYLIIIIFYLMVACINATNDQAYIKNTYIDLSIIPPCAGYYCDGYSVNVNDSIITVYIKNTVLENDVFLLGNSIDSIRSILSKEKIDSINNLVNEIEPLNNLKDGFSLDAWTYSIKTNNGKILVLNTYSLYEETDDKHLKALQKLIKYLILISPMEIKPREFA